MISYPEFGGDTFMFPIPDMINEFRELWFIFRDGVEFKFFMSEAAWRWPDLKLVNPPSYFYGNYTEKILVTIKT